MISFDGPAETKISNAEISLDISSGPGVTTYGSSFSSTTVTNATAIFTDQITSALNDERSPITAESDSSKYEGYAEGSSNGSNTKIFAEKRQNLNQDFSPPPRQASGEDVSVRRAG